MEVYPVDSFEESRPISPQFALSSQGNQWEFLPAHSWAQNLAVWNKVNEATQRIMQVDLCTCTESH